MPDQYTKVTTTGYGSRIMNSLKGIVVGIALFFGSFGLLFWNEGRMDLSLIAKTAIDIPADTMADATVNGKLVSTTGNFTSTEELGDDQFLKPGKYLAYARTVEVYAWVEHEETQSQTNTGGSETTTKTYTYSREWVKTVPDSDKFNAKKGHENPKKVMEDDASRVRTAKVGVYDLDMGDLDLPSLSKLSLSDENVSQERGFQVTDSKDYLFLGTGTFAQPDLGDMRVSYEVLPFDQRATVFGQWENGRISAYVDAKNNRLYRAFLNSRDGAIAELHTEYVVTTWLLRLLGFLMMWIGLAMLLGPVSVVLDVLPVFGKLSRAMVGVLTFIVALVLSLVTIIISAILHSLVAVVVALAIALLALVVLMKMKSKKTKVATA